MFTIIGWVIYGLFIGLLAACIAHVIKLDSEKTGCLTLIVVGILGSIVGSVINVILFAGHYNHFGLLTNILGALITLVVYHKVKTKTP